MKKISAEKETSSSTGKVAGTIGLAASLVVAAATAYYFYGKDGKQHRQQAGAWSKKAKLEVLQKIKQMKAVSQKAYHKAVEEVLAKYKLVKDINPQELHNFGQELKAHWAEISKEAAKLTNKNKAKKTSVII